MKTDCYNKTLKKKTAPKNEDDPNNEDKLKIEDQIQTGDLDLETIKCKVSFLGSSNYRWEYWRDPTCQSNYRNKLNSKTQVLMLTSSILYSS